MEIQLLERDTEIRGDLEVKDNAEIDGNFEVDGFADFHNNVRILGKLEILNEVEVDTIIGDGRFWIIWYCYWYLLLVLEFQLPITGGIYEISCNRVWYWNRWWNTYLKLIH